MLKKLIIVVFTFFFLGLYSPPQIFAHFPETDNSMTVELHVDPDDDPTPGEQAYLYFLLKDSRKKFKLSKCKCIVSISEQGKQIFRKELSYKKDEAPSIWGAKMSYVFPKNGLYQVTLTGSPVVSGSFQPFEVSWNFRVDPYGSPGLVRKGPSDIQILLGAVVAVLMFVGLFGWFIKKKVIDTEKMNNDA